MKGLRQLYLNFFVIVYGLYAYFNKGVAYSYLVEVLLVLGIALIILNRGEYEIVWNKPLKFIVFFLAINSLAFVLAIGKYPFIEIIQDSFIFYYSLFVFVVFLLAGEFEQLKSKLFLIYKWYPPIVFFNFLLVSYVPFFQEYKLFGDIPLMLYKYGDMGVHLLISTLLLLGGWIKLPKKWTLIYVLLISFLFLVIASYNRAGMLAYIVGLATFFIVYRKRFSRETIGSYLRTIPLLLVLVLGIYANAHVEENFQGRTLGLNQLTQNISSIVSGADEGTSLADNKVWRLAWWYKIVTDAVEPKNAIVGQGLGINLASISDVRVDNDNLRSPHNFHLNILARFGFIVFGAWLVFMALHIKKINAKPEEEFKVLILIAILAFLINATFDVYLEGPMGAFPFWTWLGILYLIDAKTAKL